MKYPATLAAWAIALVLFSADPTLAETAYLQHHDKWVEQPSRTVDDIARLTSSQGSALSKYGGLADVTVEATGFFRTAKFGGRWWLIDPEGHPFLSIGMCTVSPYHLYPESMKKAFGDRDQWIDSTAKVLKGNGFNTLACWSWWKAFQDEQQRIPYTPSWSFMGAYKQKRPKKNGARGQPQRTIPVFDAEFETFCAKHAKRLIATRDDPWLLGHFIDNELPFRPNALENYLNLPPSDVGHQVAKAWWAERCEGDPNRKITQQDNYDFLYKVASRYYTIVAAAVRKVDPNHLILGSRIHGRTIKEPVFRASAPLDVVSVNYYHRWSPERGRLNKWVKWSGKPFISSEWYAMTIDSPKKYIRGAGFKVKRERDQGLYYQNYTIGLSQHPGCVGWHWYKYCDDHRPRPLGIYDREAQTRDTLLEMMRQVNRQIYPLALGTSGLSLTQVGDH